MSQELMIEQLTRYVKFLILFVIIWAVIWVWNNISIRKSGGDEMAPGLPRDKFKFIYVKKKLPADIERDDVIYYDFEQPGKQQQSVFSRVVGKPGDVVRIEKGEVYVNNAKIREDYVYKDNRSSEDFVEVIVPRDTYFLVCDNRRGYKDYDSRGVGPVGVWAVLGKDP